MKHAKKFMVVPYEEKKIVNDTKISDILNNPQIDQEKKVKLINQILVSSQKKNVIPTNNDVNETIDDSFQNSFNLNENVNQTNENFDKTINNETRKTPSKKLNTLEQVNKKLDQLNASINNGYLNLAPAFSTRQNTKDFDDKIDLSLSNKTGRIKRLKKKPNLNLEFLKEKVTKTVNQLNKSQRKRKFEINPNQFNETFEEDMDTLEPKVHIGNGWTFYKKNQ